MLRTTPLAEDVETVAVVRPTPLPPPVAAQMPDLSPVASEPFPCTLPCHGVAPRQTLLPPPPHDATATHHPGAIIAGRYQLLCRLGRGGMGDVWSARHVALNTEVALKFLSTDGGGARHALERFHFEAQVSAQLGQKTSHVVAVYDSGSDDAGPYLVMEHVRGRTLRTELTRRGPLALEAVATLLDQVAEALGVAHTSGIVHRDLKPSNLLLVDQPDRSLYVKVADFGIAKALHSDLAVDRPQDTSRGWMLGSPAYMSPEQVNGGRVDARTDMWALGVIVYEALTGRLPFPGKTATELLAKISVGTFDAPSRVRPSLPFAVDAWCVRAFASKRSARFATVEEMARELRRALAARPPRRLPRMARAAAAALSLAAALFALRPAPSEALPEKRRVSGDAAPPRASTMATKEPARAEPVPDCPPDPMLPRRARPARPRPSPAVAPARPIAPQKANPRAPASDASPPGGKEIAAKAF